MTRWPARAAAGILLLWYGLTMARDLLWFDTGELALVGAQFGLGHPPGQPVYTLLLGLFARLPGVDPLLGMNLFSALCAALCALPAGALIRRCLPEVSPGARFVCLLAIGAIAPVWDQASRIELYALASLLSLCILAGGAARPTRARDWAVLGALTGLLVGVNPIFAIAAATGAGLFALPALLQARRLPHALGAAIITSVAVAGLGYAYVFAVRDAPDRMVWGPLQSGADWWAYLTGRDYGHTAHSAWSAVPTHLWQWFEWLLGQGALPAVALGWLGWALPAARRGIALLALPLLAGVAFTFTYGVFHPQVPDYNGYLMPALWLGAVGLAAIAHRIHWGVALAVLLLTASTGARPIWQRSRANVDLPRRLASRLLADLPQRALLIVESDHLVFPLMYLQGVEHQRPDVVVFNAGFGASSWYWAWQRRLHPDLPAINLAAPDTATRLRRLSRAGDRPVFAESVGWAGHLRTRPCPRGLVFGLGPTCAFGDDPPDAWDTLYARPSTDPITRRVVAAEAWRRAQGLWLMGDARGAIEALRGGADLPVPRALQVPPNRRPLPPSDAPVLIGDPLRNRAVGAQLLTLCGQRSAAEAWLAAPVP